MAWCRQLTSHCLNQCWLTTSQVLWHSQECNFTWNDQDIYIFDMCLEMTNLTHWGRVTHIHVCVSKLTTIISDNGLLPALCQANIWTNAGILLTGPLGTNFSEILIEIYTFSVKKMHLMAILSRPQCVKDTNALLKGHWVNTISFEGNLSSLRPSDAYMRQ